MKFPSAASAVLALCALTPASAQVRLTDPATGELYVGDTSTCAAQGVRAVGCGSDNVARPDACCQPDDGSGLTEVDLYCSTRSGGSMHMRCWPLQELQDQEGVTSTDVLHTGALQTDEPDPEGGGETVPTAGVTDAPVAAPTEAVPPPTEAGGTCAKLGERSQACGAENTERPATCCAGLKCPDGAGVRCETDPDADATGGAPDGEVGADDGVSTGSQGEEIVGTVATGDITVQGTAFSSTMNSEILVITVPEGTPAKSFVMMFMGDSNGDPTIPERAAYHDNWIHLTDIGPDDGTHSNLRVQHKFWSGNRPDFKVWDDPDTAATLNKFIVMPSMGGIAEDDPIVDSAAVRIAQGESFVAPSVYGVEGGAVVVMYLMDSWDGNNFPTVMAEGFTLLRAEEAMSGEIMGAFVAPTSAACTGTVEATGIASTSGIAMAVSLRPVGGAAGKEECDQDAAASTVETPDGVETDETPDADTPGPTTAAPTESETVETPSPTAASTDGDTERPTDEPTLSPTADPVAAPTSEPTEAPVEAPSAGFAGALPSILSASSVLGLAWFLA